MWLLSIYAMPKPLMKLLGKCNLQFCVLLSSIVHELNCYMEIIIRYGLFVYLLLTFILTFAWPSYRVWRVTGHSPITFSNKDTAHDFVGSIFKILLLLQLIMVGIYTFTMSIVPYLLPFWFLDFSSFKIIGIIILLTSLIWILIAQIQMANAWRIGIDTKNDLSLVQSGLFSLTRNPIFIGMLSILFGFFLLLPNALSLLIFTSGYICMQVQVRLEEQYLHSQDQDGTYRSYFLKTPRWF